MEAARPLEPSTTPTLMSSPKSVISIPIPIPKNNSYDNINFSEEYSLHCNNFNPSKMSPPDDWKCRLHQRINYYCSNGSNEKNK